jgi:ribosome biogenesis protein BRX1
MGELGFGGNCLKGGRGVVVFDKSFDDQIGGSEVSSLLREMLRGVFCVPSKGVRGMKPFIDRIIGIYGLDGKIWIRIYEIRESEKKLTETQKAEIQAGTDISLVEIGPRFVLTPIVVLEGSFGGPVLFENKEFVSPNQIRSEARLRKAGKYGQRRDEAERRVIKKRDLEANGRRRSALENGELFG